MPWSDQAYAWLAGQSDEAAWENLYQEAKTAQLELTRFFAEFDTRRKACFEITSVVNRLNQLLQMQTLTNDAYKANFSKQSAILAEANDSFPGYTFKVKNGVYTVSPDPVPMPGVHAARPQPILTGVYGMRPGRAAPPRPVGTGFGGRGLPAVPVRAPPFPPMTRVPVALAAPAGEFETFPTPAEGWDQYDSSDDEFSKIHTENNAAPPPAGLNRTQPRFFGAGRSGERESNKSGFNFIERLRAVAKGDAAPKEEEEVSTAFAAEFGKPPPGVPENVYHKQVAIERAVKAGRERASKPEYFQHMPDMADIPVNDRPRVNAELERQERQARVSRAFPPTVNRNAWDGDGRARFMRGSRNEGSAGLRRRIVGELDEDEEDVNVDDIGELDSKDLEFDEIEEPEQCDDDEECSDLVYPDMDYSEGEPRGQGYRVLDNYPEDVNDLQTMFTAANGDEDEDEGADV